MINVIVKHIFKLVAFFVTFPKEAKALLKVSQLWYKYSNLPSSVLSIHFKVRVEIFKVGGYSIFKVGSYSIFKVGGYSIFKVGGYSIFKVGSYSIFNAPNDYRSTKIPRCSIYLQN
jgi:hypothetical protein